MREYPMLRIRISPKLKSELEAIAKAHNRSLNAEVTNALEFYFNSGSPDANRAMAVGEIEDRLARIEKHLGLEPGHAV